MVLANANILLVLRISELNLKKKIKKKLKKTESDKSTDQEQKLQYIPFSNCDQKS